MTIPDENPVFTHLVDDIKEEMVKKPDISVEVGVNVVVNLKTF